MNLKVTPAAAGAEKCIATSYVSNSAETSQRHHPARHSTQSYGVLGVTGSIVGVLKSRDTEGAGGAPVTGRLG